MPTPPIEDGTLIERYRAWKELGTVKASHSLGVSESIIRRSVDLCRKRGLVGDVPGSEGYEIKAHSAQFDEDGNVKSRSVKYTQPLGEEWATPDGHTVKGISALIDADGRTVQQWVKTTSTLAPSIDDVRNIFRDFQWTAIRVPLPKETDSDLLTIYPIADLHLSLQAFADESGSDYNLDIAEERFKEKADKLFLQSPPSGTALVAYLGDWTHQNDNKNITPTSGHYLQVSNPLYQTVRRGVKLAVAHTYKALERHGRVIIKVLRGNHDLESWIGLVVGLEEHFIDEPRVTVDISESDYWFFRWGTTLLGFHHGHRMKPDQMAGAMAMECREDWGETDYRLFLHGHLHHKRAIEVLGVSVECMRTLADVDQHHSGKFGSQKSLISITIHNEEGEESRSQVNMKPIKKKAARVE